MAKEVRYRIHVPLQDFEGAKSEKTYTCTRGARFWAPEGEFKALSQTDYSRLQTRSSSDTDTEA